MDTLIENGDFKRSQNGLPIAINGEQELLQRAKICLCVPRGSFLHNKNLGSRLFDLPNSSVDAKNALALSMAQEALKKQPQIIAYSAQVQYENKKINAVKIMLLIENKREEVIVQL